MAAWQRRKGRAGEQELVRLAKEHGVDAQRCWTSAQNWDVSVRAVDVRVSGLPYQCKRRARAWADLYKAIEYVTGVFFRADNQEWLLAIRPQHYFELLKKAGLAKDETGDTNAGERSNGGELPTNPPNVPCVNC